MGREVPSETRALVQKLIRAGNSMREVARNAGCSLGFVCRVKKEMGLVREVRHHPKAQLAGDEGRLPSAGNLSVNRAPSPAALRLALFDPIVARALAKRVNSLTDKDDG